MRNIYQGKLKFTHDWDDRCILWLDKEYSEERHGIGESLAHDISQDFDISTRNGEDVEIQYCFSGAPIDEKALPDMQTYKGRIYAGYFVCNDTCDCTWDELFIDKSDYGRYNFLDELKEHVGEYLYMIIECNKEVKPCQ
jgi:hypothetical protein